MIDRANPLERRDFLALSAAALLLGGCSGNSPAPKGEPAPPPAAKPAAEGPITYAWAEEILKERIAWRSKATKVLLAIVDEKSADAAIPQLKELIREDESLNQRASRSKTRYPPEIEKPLQEKWGKENEASRQAYIDAQHAFGLRTQKEALAKYVEKKHDLSITRMKLVEREK